MDPYLPTVRQLLSRWKAEGRTLLPPPGALALEQLEERHGIRLPPDLRAYFSLTGGLPDGDIDVEGIGWWAPERIVPLSTYCRLAEASGFFIVADMLWECTHYAIQLHTTARWPYGTVIEGMGAHHRVRAASWSNFLWLRLQNPDLITRWREDQPDDGPSR